DAAKRECRGRAASDDETGNRNLVWRDSRFAKKRDDCRFDWSVNVSGHVECSILRGIQNNALGETTFLCSRCGKTEWPHMPAHADDVIVNFCCVHGIDFTSVGLLLQFLKTRRALRPRQKEAP